MGGSENGQKIMSSFMDGPLVISFKQFKTFKPKIFVDSCCNMVCSPLSHHGNTSNEQLVTMKARVAVFPLLYHATRGFNNGLQKY